jgi:hypothetical protein
VKFKDETFPEVTLDDFCEVHGLVVVVRERPGEVGDRRYYATCDDVDLWVPDNILESAMGNASSKEEAVRNYAAKLAGRKIVVGPLGPTPVELQCPNVWRV